MHRLQIVERGKAYIGSEKCYGILAYLDVGDDATRPERLDTGLHVGVLGASCASISPHKSCR